MNKKATKIIAWVLVIMLVLTLTPMAFMALFN